MSFLNPAILFGLLAAAIPIIFHFLNLRKVKKIEFSSIKFLKELQQTKIKRLKFKQWLLLLLRVLIIASIVLAFARPTIKSRVVSTESSIRKNVYFILDNSMSMGRLGNEGSLINRAKKSINEILNSTSLNDNIYLLGTTTDSITTLTNPDLNNIKKAVGDFESNDSKGNLNTAIISALTSANNSDRYYSDFFILSDFQKNNVDTSKLAEIAGSVLPSKRVNLYFLNFAEDNLNNLSISDIELKNQIIRPGQEITISAVVTNHSENDISNQTASLFINGIRRSLKSFSLNAKESKSIDMIASLNDSGYVFMNLQLEDDDILSDNNQYISFFVPGEVPVVFPGRTESGKFVETVLQESQSISLEKYFTTADEKRIIIDFINARLNTENLYNAISEGADVLLFPDKDIDNSLLTEFYNTFNLSSGTLNGSANVYFNKTNYDHPVLKSIFIKDDQSIDSPEIRKYIRRETGSNESAIISLSDGSPFLSEINIGKGKLFLFSVSPSLSWADFPIKGIFAPLILKSIYYLSSINPEANLLICGSTMTLSTKSVSSNIKVDTPDKSEFIPLDSFLENNSYSYKTTERAGFYKFFSNDNLLSAFAVNYDPEESVNTYYSVEDLIGSFDSNNISSLELNAEQNISEQIEKNQFGSELWKHLILLAIILAIVEMFVSRTSKKDLVTIKE